MSEENRASKDEQKKQLLESKAEIMKELDDIVASGYTAVYINSLGKEVGFKEVTVAQQKTISRVMIGNEQRKDIIYDAQCAVINKTALMEGFDIYNYTELERIKILMALYQANMFNDDVQFTCKQCGMENKYKISFDNVLRKLDEIPVEPRKFTYEHRGLKYDFTIAYPNVKLVSTFHKLYFAKYPNKSKRDEKVNDTMSNMEYINLFIKSFGISRGEQFLREFDLSHMRPDAIDELLQHLPQDVLYAENGVLQFVTKELLQKLNDSFDKHTCKHCGTVQEDETTN